MMSRGYWIGIIYMCLIAIFTPFTFHYFTIQHSITDFLFGEITQLLAQVWKLKIDPQESFTSDSIQLYLLYLVLMPIAILLFLLCKRLHIFQENRNKIKGILSSFLVYYLALISLKYGLDKLNGQQFDFPESNLLFTPMGYLDKDILYWSVMGSSPGYLYFLGGIEILAAILLFFRRTRFIGIIIAVITYSQVLAINLSFDISVKLYSAFVLTISLYLLLPYAKEIYLSLKFQKPLKFLSNPFTRDKKYYLAKSVVALFILLESVVPAYESYRIQQIQPKNGNLYGAYEVLNTTNPMDIKRIFIHKDNYFIVQTMEDDFIDYRLQWSTKEDAIYLTDYDNQTLKVPFRWYNTDSLEFIVNNIPLIGSPIDIEKLPLRQKLFHWSVD